MLFNSFHFAVFFPVVFALYWFLTNKSLKIQNLLLLFSSYFFYACWDYKFLFLLVFSTLLDYYSAIKIHKSDTIIQKKIWFWFSIIINLGFLGIFKYYNFFADSLVKSLHHIGLEVDLWTLSIILPVGISFYTFHGLSYVIDVYKQRIKPSNSFIEYGVFVSFFPLLVAGPIERATHLLPQIQKHRQFKYGNAVNGAKQILWGLFKKIVIADNCAEYANIIFNGSANYSGTTLLLGAIFFTFQIYCDFSGYSDIALGTARLLGIELLQNFSFPYFSRDIAEFWRRWHISLSSWFKDYIYFPLGGSKGGILMKIRNTFIIFLLSGFWHGANWTFIAWGLLNAVYFLPSLLFNTNRNNIEIVAKGQYLPSIGEFFSISLTFSLTVFAWIFFRAENLNHAFTYISTMAQGLFMKSAYIQTYNFLFWQVNIAIIILTILFVIVEWFGRESKYAIENLGVNWNKSLRWSMYYAIVFMIFYFTGKEQQFIYFQF